VTFSTASPSFWSLEHSVTPYPPLLPSTTSHHAKGIPILASSFSLLLSPTPFPPLFYLATPYCPHEPCIHILHTAQDILARTHPRSPILSVGVSVCCWILWTIRCAQITFLFCWMGRMFFRFPAGYFLFFPHSTSQYQHFFILFFFFFRCHSCSTTFPLIGIMACDTETLLLVPRKRRKCRGFEDLPI